MYKTYNRIYTEPDTRKMKLIKTEKTGNKFTSPKAYYNKHTGTLLIQYTYMRICLRDDNTRYESGYHHEYTKRTVTITNPVSCLYQNKNLHYYNHSSHIHTWLPQYFPGQNNVSYNHSPQAL